jgi:adenine-specific DNA-methyltransferase
MNQKFEKLKVLLKELFQLDQPDLDFGLYRIMHAKSAEVTQFLDKDLLPQMKDAFALYKTADKVEIEKELAKVVAGIEAAGMDPEQSPKVKELRVTLKSDAVDLGALESEVYDHLFSFFRRYYSEGDFLAKRVYKPGVYAIPYEGEEVTLHWANKDQYYIKTSEYLRDYAFRLRPDDDKKPMRVHFRLADAAEGEHGNIKAADGKDRVFILAAANGSGADFIAEEGGEQGKELSIRFEYRSATLTDWPEEAREGKTKSPAQKDLSALAAKRILAVTEGSLVPWIAELGKPHVTASGEKADYTRLEAHLRRYTARNTFDYFIHKDLGSFLRRELDFYIKNEVMHLDDVENELAPRVEQYLSKIKVIRNIAGKIIEFLAQLEDFQKKLWLKKKFVVGTSWCIRLSCISETFYSEIAANEGQREEWVKLLAIDEIEDDLIGPAYSVPLKPEFLKAHSTLQVDTRHFDAESIARLAGSIVNIDEQTDGVLVHSENAHALSLMASRYRRQVGTIYIDPPYNTGSDGFAYKDTYQYSSWHAMMDDRLALAQGLLSRNGVLLSSIDDIERAALDMLLDSRFGGANRVGTLVWKGATDNNPTRIAVEHEYILCYAQSKDELDEHWSDSASETKQMMLDAFERIRQQAKSPTDIVSSFEEFATAHREELGDLYRYRRVDSKGPYAARRNMENPGKPGYKYDVIHPVTGRPCTLPYWGWRFPETTMKKLLADERIIFGEDESKIPELKVYLRDVKFPLRSVFTLDARKGSNDLDRLFAARDVFKNPKPTELLTHLLPFTAPPGSLVLDFFAGSGTTGHAVINLNRDDGGQRQFLVVEAGDHFDTVLLPRLKKAAYTPKWKGGKPERHPTPEEAERSPRIMKIVRLESYDDVLNNLDVRRTALQQTLLDGTEAQGADGFKEQYLLRYMLDVEARGSQSLLNPQAFADPAAYKLRVKRPGSDESREANVDLLETFNWLIGLTVRHIAARQTFIAAFERDGEKRLRLKDRLKQDAEGPWWFRTVTGSTPDGRNTLVIWRKLTGNPEEDNLVLDEWFTKQGYSSRDSEFDLIYVNGGNNLENLKVPDDAWKVRLIEEDFHRLMFETE